MGQKISKSYLYLPIETWSREFHAKLLIAINAVENDWTVVIGPKTEMQRWLFKFPKGVVLQFGYHKNFSNIYKNLKEYGHKIASIDEEGLVILHPEYYRKYRVSENTIKNCDLCFAWGQKHSETLKKIDLNFSHKLKVVGNPRIDLCRNEFREFIKHKSSKIGLKYKNYILINGNFGSYNHSEGMDYTWKSLEQKGWFNTEEDKDFHRKRIALQGSLFESFKNLVSYLARKSNYKIVIRPHPSEAIQPWEELAKSFDDNVYVERDGNVLPWIYSSAMMIHNGCTTSIESLVMNKPVISYRPFKSLKHEAELPHQSNEAETQEEVLDLIKNIGSIHSKTYSERMKILEEHVSFLKDEMSHTAIVKDLNNVRILTSDLLKESTKDLVINKLRHCAAQIFYHKKYRYVLSKCFNLDKKIVLKEASILGFLDLDNKIKVENCFTRLVMLMK